MINEVKYYHGGDDDIRVGEYVLPPSITGKKSTADMPIKGASVCSKQKVYVTTSYEAAMMFACSQRNPMVYMVEPENLEHDPDCSVQGLSYSCDKARVIAKARPQKSLVKQIRQALLLSLKGAR